MKLFFAAFPAPEIRRRIESRVAALCLPKGALLVPAGNYHITVAFAGEVSSEQASALHSIGAVVRCPRFEVAFDAHEYWQKSGVAVAAAGECPPALLELHRTLRASLDGLDLPGDRVPFRAHVTVARKVTQPPVLEAMSKFSWEVRAFHLVRSERSPEGSAYTVLDTWQLLDMGAQPK